MHDLLIKGGRVVDQANSTDRAADIAITEGRVAEIGEDLSPSCARETLDASGKLVVPGIIDMHTHMRTQLGHPHAQRMVAKAGVCTAIDLAGPLDNILGSIPGSGSSINVGILEAARAGMVRAIREGRAGVLRDSGTAIICDARGETYLKSRGIACRAKGELDPERIRRRFVPAC